MNDQISIKKLLASASTLSQANTTTFPGSAILLDRIASPVHGVYLRTMEQDVISSLPGVHQLRIQHQPRKGLQPQRSLASFDLGLERRDGEGNLIRVTDAAVKFMGEIPEDMTQAEFVAAGEFLCGLCLADGGAFLKALYLAQV